MGGLRRSSIPGAAKLVFIAALSAFTAVAFASTADTPVAGARGREAPAVPLVSMADITLRALPGSPRRAGVLAQYHGRYVALLLYEDQCTYCLRTLRALSDVAREDGIIVIGVGVGPSVSALHAWGRRAGPSVPLVHANGRMLAALGGVRATPVLVILDDEGRIIATIVGEQNAGDITLLLKRTVLTIGR